MARVVFIDVAVKPRNTIPPGECVMELNKSDSCILVNTRKGSFRIEVDSNTPNEIISAKWLIHTNGYAYRTEYDDTGRRLAIPLSRAIMGLSPDDPRRVKFRNGNQLDCRKVNLEVFGMPHQIASPALTLVDVPVEPTEETEVAQEITYPELTRESFVSMAEDYDDEEVRGILRSASIRNLSDKKLVIEMGFSTSPQLIRAKLIRYASSVFGFSGSVECIIKPSVVRSVAVEKKGDVVKSVRVPCENEAKMQHEEHALRTLKQELEEARLRIKDLETTKQLESVNLRSFHAESKVTTTIVEGGRGAVSLVDVPTEQLIRELKARGAIRIVF